MLTDTPEFDDPFQGQLGRCAHCGAPFTPSIEQVDAAVFTLATDEGNGKAGSRCGVIFLSQCPACGTRLWAPHNIVDEWAKCDPALIAWYRSNINWVSS